MTARRLRALAGALLLLCTLARAEPADTGYSDLWWNPAQNGWGLALQRQGDVIFAALYAYDAAGQPTWYVASDVRPSPSATPGSDRWAGTLYRVAGSPFAAAYDAGTSVAPVGTLGLSFEDPQAGHLDYTIDGVAVSTRIARQTWRVPTLSGTYRGGFSTLASSCNDPNRNGPFEFTGATSLAESGSAATLRIESTQFGGVASTCTFNGTRTQAGRLGAIEGTFACSIYDGTDGRGESPAIDGRRGPFRLDRLEVSAGGYAGRMVANDQDCRYEGQVGGVRVEPAAPRDYSDLWWNPAQPGWGAHLTLQGDVLFAVLFVHGSDRRATFFVASDMRATADATAAAAYEGTLYRTTGTPVGGAYDAARFSATAVGKARIAFDSPTSARIRYEADGVAVEQVVTRQTWSVEDLRGRYLGGLEASAAGCPFGTGASTLSFPGSVEVTPSGDTITIDTRFAPGFAEGGNCRYVGRLATSGSIASVTAGTFGCEFSIGTSFGGSFEMTSLKPTPAGFTASFRATSGACQVEGRFGSFRQVEAPPTTMPE